MRALSWLAKLVVLPAVILLVHCKGDSSTGTNLPQGCQAQGVYAIAVVDANLTCLQFNAFTDVEEALGSPDAEQAGEGRLEFFGFVSLGIDGSLTLFMGSCIQDLPGADLRVFQSVSREAVEVQVSANEGGPFISLGVQNCTNSCDFDLSGSGLNNVRFVKVFDRESITFPGAQCDNSGASPGADLDSVEVLHAAS